MNCVPQKPFNSFYSKWICSNNDIISDITGNRKSKRLVTLIKINQKNIFFASKELITNYKNILSNQVYNFWAYSFYPEYYESNLKIYICVRLENNNKIYLWLPNVITDDLQFLNNSIYNKPELILNGKFNKKIKYNLFIRCLRYINTPDLHKLFLCIPNSYTIQLCVNSKNT